MPDPVPHPAQQSVDQLLAESETERLRRSGPGGQHRNKVETAVRITHRPTGITAMATERRSQSANLSQAIQRLRVNLALEARTSASGAPSDLWQSRCVGQRIHISVDHDDFAALLAEALNVLAACGWDLSQAAASLDCTPSQMLKLLRKEPRALGQLNQQRVAHQQNPYR